MGHSGLNSGHMDEGKFHFHDWHATTTSDGKKLLFYKSKTKTLTDLTSRLRTKSIVTYTEFYSCSVYTAKSLVVQSTMGRHLQRFSFFLAWLYVSLFAFIGIYFASDAQRAVDSITMFVHSQQWKWSRSNSTFYIVTTSLQCAAK